jgi:hypothetical protein
MSTTLHIGGIASEVEQGTGLVKIGISETARSLTYNWNRQSFESLDL